MNNSDLDSKMNELRKELMKVGSQVATGTVPKSPGKVKEMKRTIAQIVTIKQQNAQKQAQKPAAVAANPAQKSKGGSKKE
jgi:large subunit ribosomal protein L29